MKGRVTDGTERRKSERQTPSICCFTTKKVTMMGTGQAENRSLELQQGLTSTPEHHMLFAQVHYQEDGSKAEQQSLQAAVWMSGSQWLNHRTKAQAPVLSRFDSYIFLHDFLKFHIYFQTHGITVLLTFCCHTSHKISNNKIIFCLPSHFLQSFF